MNPITNGDSRSSHRISITAISLIATSALLANQLSAQVSPPAVRELFPQELPLPEQSGIEHVIVVTMENRSFDHFLGWVPNADGQQQGLTYFDENGAPHSTFRLSPDYQGCSHPDPDHSFEGGRIEFNNGACDGWLLAGDNDVFSIGFYTRQDLRFFTRAAVNWTICDRYFSSIMAETWPNKIYALAGQTDRLTNSFQLCTLPTIFDRLAEAGLSARYYFSDVPFVALWGLKYLPISRFFNSFLADAASGTLPAVSFIDPRFIGADIGTSVDDHPHADVRNGQLFMERIYRAVVTSPNWPSTVLVFTYDEWGGFFDHVPPPVRQVSPAEQALGNDGLLGFRVPCIIVSPFAPARVSSLELEHSSVLRMIEWRWNLQPLTVRDATANNLADALDFSNKRLNARPFPVPQGPFGEICPGVPDTFDKWDVLRVIAIALGWPID